MRVVVIVAHPRQGSFNHAIARTVQTRLQAHGHEVSFRDLYQENFDPLFQLNEFDQGFADPRLTPYLDEVVAADAFVIVHPNWWGQPPAILKGWIDRVLRSGVTYEFAPGVDATGVPTGLLHAQFAIVFNTSNTPPAREIAVFGDPLETLWRNCIFQFCGVNRVFRRTFSTIAGSSESQRMAWLEEVGGIIDTEFYKC